MDNAELMEIFIDEAKEHLQNLNEHLLILEKEPENENTINEIFRAAHSLKGMSGTMGYTRMQRLTHDMENVFQEIRSGNMKVRSELTDVLFEGLDALQEYLDNIIETNEEGSEDNEKLIDLLDRELKIGLGKTEEKTEAEVMNEPEEKLSIKLEKYELEAIKESEEDGLYGYEIYVTIDEKCLLRSVRAYMCLREMEALGELIKALPDTKSIEEEKMGFEFVVVLLTEENESVIHNKVASVSEIKDVKVTKIDPGNYGKEDQKNKKSCGTVNGRQEEDENVRSSENITGSGASKKASAGRSLRVDIEKLDELMNLVSELIIAKNAIVSIKSEDLTSKEKQSIYNEQIENLERITTSMHRSVMKVRMVPIENAVNKFPRMIRDLSKKLNKPMNLIISGEDTELDRTVIDEIGDPLQHILRNSADHGLESPEERRRLGKPEEGNIYLEASQEGNSVVIKCRDDGGGINIERVKEKAIEKGTISKEQAELMTDRDFISLLFRPSFSTADKISDISGRGVGLDVVKTKIESLGGSVECTSERHIGTTFTIRLPLTLAIIESLMVEVSGGKYVIPLGSIETIEDIEAKDICKVEGREAINIRDRVIPIIRMNELLETGKKKESAENLTMVIVRKGEKKAGLIVDELYGQLEAVIKPIGRYISYPRSLSGATILGNGEIALILDVNAMI